MLQVEGIVKRLLELCDLGFVVFDLTLDDLEEIVGDRADAFFFTIFIVDFIKSFLNVPFFIRET